MSHGNNLFSPNYHSSTRTVTRTVTEAQIGHAIMHRIAFSLFSASTK